MGRGPRRIGGVTPDLTASAGKDGSLMDTGLEALATALYVTVDDLLKDHPEVLPPHP